MSCINHRLSQVFSNGVLSFGFTNNKIREKNTTKNDLTGQKKGPYN